METARARHLMVDQQLRPRGITDPHVLDAMSIVAREQFVPPELVPDAYADRPLPIGAGQTISQPYIVALMAEALALKPTDFVLEVGTGSGYAAAVLSMIATRVYTIERHFALADLARVRLRTLGYANVEVRCGDGTLGWPEAAPFDAISVAAGGPDAPPSLVEQLAVGGRLVIPIGPEDQQHLVRITRISPTKVVRENLGDVMFVPLIGKEGWSEDDDPAVTQRWRQGRPS